jgi:pimeloyl-ACP methyl ester carboxylesterase
VIWGDRDMTLRPDSFPSLVNILPRASGIPIAHSGHQPHIGKPALVSRLVLEFLDVLESSDSQATRS